MPQFGRDSVPAEMSLPYMQPAIGSPNLTDFVHIGKEQWWLQHTTLHACRCEPRHYCPEQPQLACIKGPPAVRNMPAAAAVV